MAADPFVAHLLELLAPLGQVRARRMFGGWGLYLDELMFGLVLDSVFYLKTDDANRPDFAALGLEPFAYRRRGARRSMSYYPPPAEALDEPGALEPWARGALAAARRAKAPSDRGTRRTGRRGRKP